MSIRWLSPFTTFFIAFCAIPMRANCQIVLQKPSEPGCIAAHTFTELPASIAGTQTDAYGKTTVALGAYERVSPDGRFILRSYSGARLGEVSLIELGAKGEAVRAIPTPLKNEAFPVQGSWRYLVDINGDHYVFNSIVGNLDARKVPFSADFSALKSVFKGGMDGFYAAASELPPEPNAKAAEPPNTVRIRSMSWPNANANGNANTQGQGALSVRTITVDTARHRIVADTGAQFICRERRAEDGAFYALPMISVDGREFAALPQNPIKGEPHMRIFSFGPDGKSCEAKSAFNFASGKTIFGFPHHNSPADASSLSESRGADVAYEYKGQAWWVNRAPGVGEARLSLAPYLDNPQSLLLASAFPGITRDGRIIYAATFKDCSGGNCIERGGYVTTDPYQSNAYQQWLQVHKGPARRQCITEQDVQREREAFARFHGLSAKP
jgi:hypothetical protein